MGRIHTKVVAVGLLDVALGAQVPHVGAKFALGVAEHRSNGLGVASKVLDDPTDTHRLQLVPHGHCLQLTGVFHQLRRQAFGDGDVSGGGLQGATKKENPRRW